MIVGKVNWSKSKSKKAMHLFETPALFDIKVNSQVESSEWQKTISIFFILILTLGIKEPQAPTIS